MADDPCVSLGLSLDPTALGTGAAPGEEGACHLVVELRGLGGPVDRARPSLDVVCCLDVSGSMQGEPLEQVCESLDSLLGLLEESDRLAVVAFSHQASLVAGLEPLDARRKALLRRRVWGLHANGPTNIEAGLRAAAGCFPEQAEGRRQLILLLSDGQPNREATTPEKLADVVRPLRPEIGLSTLGYGPHHDEDVLSAVADAGGGGYFFVSAPAEAEMEFARAVGAQGDTVADAVSLTLMPADGVEIDALLGDYQTRFTKEGLTLALPDLYENMPRYVVARLSVSAPDDVADLDALTVTVRARRAGTRDTTVLTEEVKVPIRPARGRSHPDARPRVLLAQAEIERRAARRLADGRNFEGAAACLRRVLKRIEEDSCYAAGDGSDLSESYEQLLDEAVAYERKPGREEYAQFRKATLGMDLQAGGRQANDLMGASSARHLASVAGELPPAFLVVEKEGGEGQRFALGPSNTIGRVAGNEICVDSGMISKRHTRVLGKRGSFILSDLGSTNGTYLNGERLKQPAVLQDGDKVLVGDVVFRVRIGEETPSQAD